MLSYECSAAQQEYFPSHFDAEVSSVDSYPLVMDDSFDFNNTTTAFTNNMPFAFAPLPLIDELHNIKYDMVRTASNNSITQHFHEMPPALLPSRSIGSTSSSPGGSPFSNPVHVAPVHEGYAMNSHAFMSGPAIICNNDDDVQPDHDYLNTELPYSEVKYASVDPHLLSGARDLYYTQPQYHMTNAYQHSSHSGVSPSPAPSPAPSASNYPAFSQPVTLDNYSQQGRQRRSSVSSQRSGASPRTSVCSDDDKNEKGRCPHPDCGRVFKDLKAHILTHQSERPSKCPIVTCEYHTKGFARKYDKNRHTLTHYKGTMVCGFCPGSGSPVEKSFNRADVFKRHLTQVHGVEQNPPNSRKRSPGSSSKKLSNYCQDATGKCSTCSSTFNNAQDFYEHLDDCVLRIVQQEEPSEAINALRLAEVATDAAVQETFDRHMIKQEDVPQPFDDEDEDDEDDMDEDDEDDNEASFPERSGHNIFKQAKAAGARAVIGGNIVKNRSGRKGMTKSRGGVPLVCKGRKRRRFYPPSWGLSADKMKMKKRVLCVFEGQRRLLKDDMMLDNTFEVRVRLPDGKNYVTDLDVETLKRADAFHNATPEEKGPWIPEQDFLSDLL